MCFAYFLYKIACYYLLSVRNRCYLILHNMSNGLDEIPKIFNVYRIRSREKTGKREFKINMFASIQEFPFVLAHRHECRSVHLSKQTEFDCGGIVGMRANFKTRTIHRLSICLEMGTNKLRIEGALLTEETEKTMPREWKMFTPSFLDSNGNRQYSTLKISIYSDHRVIFSRFASASKRLRVC